MVTRCSQTGWTVRGAGGEDPSVRPMLDLQPVGEGAWTFDVTPTTANPVGALYGGAPLAASVMAVEEAAGAPVRWATTRFLRGGAVGDQLTVEVALEVVGRRTTHARVTGRTDDHVVFDTLAVAGAGRPDGASGQWIDPPEVPPPGDLEPVPVLEALQGSAVGTIERRAARGGFPVEGEHVSDGHLVVWMRIPGVDNGSRPVLAWLADCVPLSIAAVTGSRPGGTSLDNTIRFAGSAPTDWVLVDIQAEAADHGYGFGRVHLWAEDGTLLATGSQTAIIRPGQLEL